MKIALTNADGEVIEVWEHVEQLNLHLPMDAEGLVTDVKFAMMG